MKKALITILQYVIFLGLGIWIIYHMLHQLSDEQTKDLVNAIKSVNPWYILPIFFVGFLSHFFRALRWRYLLLHMDMRPSVLNLTFSVLIGYVANLALPRAGEVAKCTVLAKYEKMPAHKMIGTIVAERAFDLLCLFIIAALAFALQAQKIGSYIAEWLDSIHDKIEAHRTALIVGVAVLALLAVAAGVIYRRNKETKVGKLVKEMSHGIMAIIHMKERWQFIGYTFLIWFMYLLQLYIGLKCLPDTHHLGMLASLVVLVYGSVGMIVTPGGIGLYTLLVAQMLGVYHIPDVPAQAFGWIAWVVQTGTIILLGVVSLILIHPYNRRRDEQAAVDTGQNF